MSVFLDTSKRRKHYFRGGAAFFLFALLGSILLFLFGLSFASSEHTPLSYTDAAERYHYYYSAANDKKVALTIDDGPHDPATEQILSTLTFLNAPATFFYIGEHAFARPDLVKEASDLGFDVENHSFTHAQSVHSSFQRLSLELNSTGYLLNQITGKKPSLYRPPFLLGIGIDPTVNPYIEPPKDVVWSLGAGYLPVGSDIDPKDWLATSTPQILAGLEKALHDNPNGHIVLLHEDVTTARAMGDIVNYLRANGYSIVPLKELLTPPTAMVLPATLKFGDTDKTTAGDVSKLQWFLYKQDYLDPYELTGVFDQPTKDALVSFQIANKLVTADTQSGQIAGIAEVKTRDLIRTMSQVSSLVAAPAVVDHISIFTDIREGVGAVVRSAYIHIYPVFYSWLVIVIFISLLLVLGRSLGLVSLIWWGRMHKPGPLPEMLAQPGVSVIIPAYNEEENIAATVESVIRSSYPRREIIVVDDGSKDNTSGEVEGVMRAYPNDGVRLVRTENGGKARALNVGIENAQYDIIVVLDADAVLDKEALWHFTKHFVYPDVGAVAGKVCTTGSSTLLDLFQKLEYAIGQNIDKRAFSIAGAVGVVPGPAGAWRRSTIMEVGGFSTDTLVEDQDMTLMVLRASKRVVYEENAIAYTETPHTVGNFLKQRFRWVYGTMQCFWKHKGAYAERGSKGPMTMLVLPNIFIFNIVLPLMYPFADSALIVGVALGQWKTLVLPFLLFTIFDLIYAIWGVWKEKNAWKLMIAVPLQRIIYRQLLYYTVMRGIVRAFEGTGSGWNKFNKVGETRRFYFTSMLTPVPSPLSTEEVEAEAPAPAPQTQPLMVVEESVSVAK